MVTVHSLQRDKCVWCAKEQEGVVVTFTDGSISGFVCWSDFRKLLKARSKSQNNAQSKEVADTPTERESQKPNE